MSFASKLKQNKDIKINELENHFNMINFALSKFDNVLIISVQKNPYIILFTYNDEKINLLYDLHTKKSTFKFASNSLCIENITYELLVQKGLKYYINNLLETKQQYITESVNQIKNLCSKISILRENNNNELELLYKDQYAFKLKFSSDLLDWTIDLYMYSYISQNITTNNLTKKGLKGITSCFDNLIDCYYNTEYLIDSYSSYSYSYCNY